MKEDFVDELKAAEIVDLSVYTLRSYRYLKKGPAYYKKNMNVVYSMNDLENFNKNRMSGFERMVF